MTPLGVNKIGLFGTKFSCDCGMDFKTKEAMAAHAAKDHAKPAFHCDCGMDFKTKADMQAHAKKEHGM